MIDFILIVLTVWSILGLGYYSLCSNHDIKRKYSWPITILISGPLVWLYVFILFIISIVWYLVGVYKQ